MDPASVVSFAECHHDEFMEHGFVRLGRVAQSKDLAALKQRIDDIMIGRVRYENMRFQLDPDTAKEKRTRHLSHELATRNYRRIDDLEQDPLFLAYMQLDLFHQISRRYIGEQVAVFRTMLMNKPAMQGTTLPWHQDVGVGWKIDTNPIVTVWTALDAATTESGCMQIIPGSNGLGIVNKGHFLDGEQQAQHAPESAIVELEAEAGEAILLHNFLLHRSGVNTTAAPRRAFSATYMDAATRSVQTGKTFPILFGDGALDPSTVSGKPSEHVQFFHG